MERRKSALWIASVVFFSCLLLRYPASLLQFNDHFDDQDFSSGLAGHSLLALTPNLVLGATKKYVPKQFGPYKRFSSKRGTRNRGLVGIFTGVEAKTDHAIFELLDTYGPLSTRELLKLLNRYGLDIPYYSSLNKRLHALEKGRYIRKVSANQQVSRAMRYEALPLFYLARHLNNNNPDEILSKLTQTGAVILLADLNNHNLQTRKE